MEAVVSGREVIFALLAVQAGGYYYTAAPVANQYVSIIVIHSDGIHCDSLHLNKKHSSVLKHKYLRPTKTYKLLLLPVGRRLNEAPYWPHALAWSPGGAAAQPKLPSSVYVVC